MSFFKLAENLLNNLDQQTQSSISALAKNDEKKKTKKSNPNTIPENNELMTQSSSSLGPNADF